LIFDYFLDPASEESHENGTIRSLTLCFINCPHFLFDFPLALEELKKNDIFWESPGGTFDDFSLSP